MTAATAVLGGLADIRVDQEDLYRDLHRHPELAHRERRTAGLIAARLRDYGFEVHEKVGGTGVVGVLRNGGGKTVLLRADMDALPVRERTGLTYASTDTDTDTDGRTVPVMHACGHDTHVTCLLGAARLLAEGRQHWRGTLICLFQPAEELGDGAKGMVDDGLWDQIPRPDVAFGQHITSMMAGTVGTRPGPVMAASDTMRITVYGKGGHPARPHHAIDPVLLAAMIVVRLQGVVSREVDPAETAALSVLSLQSGVKGHFTPSRAVLHLSLRSYTSEVREHMLAAIERVVRAECQASGAPREPKFETLTAFPLTHNDADVTARLARVFGEFFGANAGVLPEQPGSEDFSDIPTAVGVPFSFWGFGGIDPQTYQTAAHAGRVEKDIPVNHSPMFAPVIQPTLTTGTQALVVAALDWLS